MKRVFGFLTIAAFVGVFFVANALAQSSGSVEYSNAGGLTACVLNSSSGAITGGQPCGPVSSGGGACTITANCAGGQTCQGAVACASDADCGAGTSGTCDVVNGFCANSGICSGTASKMCIGSTDVAIKTSSGNGNVFVVRPSAVIGLLTDVTVNSKQASAISSSFAGVDFAVTIPSAPKGSTTMPTPNFPVTYDSRFIQISTNLFQALSTQCAAINGGCFITFNESTLSAHSFNWVVTNLQTGNYGLTVQWTPSSLVHGIGSTATCVGPVNLTVTQNKIFTPSTGIAF